MLTEYTAVEYAPNDGVDPSADNDGRANISMRRGAVRETVTLHKNTTEYLTATRL